MARNPLALGYLTLHLNVSGKPSVQAPDSDFWIVADARPDDRQNLANRLKLCFELADQKLILHAFRQWREQRTHYLPGDFAFAIAHDGGLFCARNPSRHGKETVLTACRPLTPMDLLLAPVLRDWLRRQLPATRSLPHPASR